jgi:hypothetical protein
MKLSVLAVLGLVSMAAINANPEDQTDPRRRTRRRDGMPMGVLTFAATHDGDDIGIR